MSTQAYVQVATDGSGKRIDNTAILVPSGTIVTDASGVESALTGDIVVFRQTTTIGDPENINQRANVTGEVGRGTIMVETKQLDEISKTLTDILEFLHVLGATL